MAMERSPVNNLEIKAILLSALTHDINNAEIYKKGIKRSFEFEGFNINNIL